MNHKIVSLDDYVVTSQSHAILNTGVNLFGAQNVSLNFKCVLEKNSIIRGDLSSIDLGDYCIVGKNGVLRPTNKTWKGGMVYFPLKIGDYVYIEDDAVIKGLSIGSYVKIGKNSLISNQCIVNDGCEILPNSVIAEGTVLSPFSIYGGSPARLIGRHDEGWIDMIKNECIDYYSTYHFPHT